MSIPTRHASNVRFGIVKEELDHHPHELDGIGGKDPKLAEHCRTRQWRIQTIK